MTFSLSERQVLETEHLALMKLYGAAQRHSSSSVESLIQQLALLQAENLRLRAKTIIQLSQLIWKIEDELRTDIGVSSSVNVCEPEYLLSQTSEFTPDFDRIVHSLQAADLVICQTGCIGHGDYWRVQDHCRRTGKACVFVDPSQAIRLVRIHPWTGASEQVLPALASMSPA